MQENCCFSTINRRSKVVLSEKSDKYLILILSNKSKKSTVQFFVETFYEGFEDSEHCTRFSSKNCWEIQTFIMN